MTEVCERRQIYSNLRDKPRYFSLHDLYSSDLFSALPGIRIAALKVETLFA